MTFRFFLIASLLVASLTLAAPASAASLDNAGYLAFADKVSAAMDDEWRPEAGYYRAGGGGGEPMVNANLLLVHVVAALEGHTGPARNDGRARELARRLVAGTPFVTRPSGGDDGSQAHAPGFVSSMTDPDAAQHLVFDADVIDGLAMAYKARRELGLPDSTAALIRDRVRRVAHGSFWRWPALRLNQMNWYALIYAADQTVTGDGELLRRDFAAHLAHFLARVHPRAGTSGNFGPGMRFHYTPHFPAAARTNVDSAEYANIVFSFSRFYERARAAGMPAPNGLGVLRQWAQRLLAGYWTHGGYLNWDSGLGFKRWNQSKKLGLSGQALIGLATTEAVQPDPRYGRWAKHILDRGFELFERWMERSPGRIPPGVLFDGFRAPVGRSSAYLGAARMAANAARAVDAGLGRARSEEPPALYAFDPDIGRLAVTTPAYNTAIVAVNQGAFPYGGIELARLFDGTQEVAANTGGTAPAAFGLLLRDVSGRIVGASQTGRTRLDSSVTPLRLTRAPAGAGASAASEPGRAFAGPFRELRADGSLRSATHVMRAAHRFTPEAIETTWTASPRGGAAARRYSADVLFPSWGGRVARVTAVLRDGSRVAVGRRLPLAEVAWFHIDSERSGYVVVSLSRPRGATAHVLLPARQGSQPTPGPSLAIQLARGERFTRVALRARYAPAPDAATAAEVATRLGAR